MPFVSEAQRRYLRLNEPAVYREFKAAEERGDLDLRPPATVAAAAKRGLELRAEFNRGGTAVGVARARDLSNRRELSLDTVRRWGGDAGRTWARKIIRQEARVRAAIERKKEST